MSSFSSIFNSYARKKYGKSPYIFIFLYKDCKKYSLKKICKAKDRVLTGQEKVRKNKFFKHVKSKEKVRKTHCKSGNFGILSKVRKK